MSFDGETAAAYYAAGEDDVQQRYHPHEREASVAKKKVADTVDKDAMEAAGFAMADLPAADDGRFRLEAMSVEAEENGGKSTFALSASEFGMAAFISLDSGRGIVRKFREAGRVIGDRYISTMLPDDVDPDNFEEVADAMMPKLRELRAACRAAIEQRAVACILDTGSGLEDLVGFSINGKIGLDVYGGEGRLKKAVNSAMASLFRMFEEAPDTNLIVTHRLNTYKGDTYPIGWRQVNYEVPYVVRCVYEPSIENDPDSQKKFYARILKSKYRKELEGTRHRVDALTGYGKIAKMLLPTAAADEEED